MNMKLFLNTDGGARGNPGPGAVGIIIKNSDEQIVFELGKFIGKCTNNEAEYQALVIGLESIFTKFKESKEIDLTCKLDSELVVKQLNGLYKVKDARMQEYWKKVKTLEKNFKTIEFIHIPRSQNKEADTMVNKVLDEM